MCLFSFEGSHFAFDWLLLTTDLDRQLDEAKAVTESLRAERLFASQKPLTDSTCLRWVSSAVWMLSWHLFIWTHRHIPFILFIYFFLVLYNTCSSTMSQNDTQKSKRKRWRNINIKIAHGNKRKTDDVPWKSNERIKHCTFLVLRVWSNNHSFLY